MPIMVRSLASAGVASAMAQAKARSEFFNRIVIIVLEGSTNLIAIP